TEVEVDRVAQRADAMAGVDALAGGPAGDVAGREVAVGGVAALEVVVALLLGDLVGRSFVTGAKGDPDAAVVAQRLAHEGRLGLPGRADGQGGRVELDEG